jgi:hypothetical protein
MMASARSTCSAANTEKVRAINPRPVRCSSPAVSVAAALLRCVVDFKGRRWCPGCQPKAWPRTAAERA